MSSASYPVELTAPDISPYRQGNAGIDYVTSFDSGRPGPHVLVCALTHGNELCGAIALDFLFRQGVRPKAGRLTLAFNNVAAYQRFDAARPSASRFVDEDFNRVWDAGTLDGPRDSVELRRARELRALVGGADLLFDIHSMQHKTPPLRMRDHVGFDDEASQKNALRVEWVLHWEAASASVAIDTTLRFLLHYGVVSQEFAAPHLDATATNQAQKVVEVTEAVTIATDAFRFVRPWLGMEVLPEAGTLLGHDGANEVRTPYDRCVLIMPSLRLRKGQTAVRLGRIVN
ncbi:MAG: succinylglutamate desuccinylase/aspartoacylase family protein [Proteobacteria bacterium]|nr:succinylglutamate desuccinylase/aspartoacylase family protein [Pseudomonadota bacterium]